MSSTLDPDHSGHRVDVLELGAGEEPHPESTVTLDIREDLPHINYPGVDIGTDRWPLNDGAVRQVRAHHVLEHVPPENIGHVWCELDRVLAPGGEAIIELPHAGTWSAVTDMTHQGTGGTTPGVAEYFRGGYLEEYWPDLGWEVDASAKMSWPSIARPSARGHWQVSNAQVSHELVKLPFVEAAVEIHIRKQ